jgi:arylsulfatase A-like enzyme
MTGKYPARLQLTDFLHKPKEHVTTKLKPAPFIDHLPLEEVTLAEALKEAGYHTCFIGKWHLGGPKYFPEKQGFDINIAGCGLGHPPTYFSPYRIPTLTDGPEGEYLTDRLTEEAVKFIEEAKDRPFLLYLSHYTVHTPLQARPDLLKKYQEKAAKLPKTDAPEFAPEGTHKTRQIQNVPVYGAMVESLDQSVGRVLAKLRELHLDTNTVVFFTSDNGGLATAEGWPTSNKPLRAGKGWSYEGGVREPLLVRWPGVTKAGSICSEPVMSTDYYPTILEMARLPLRPKQHVDGQSFCAALRDPDAPIRAQARALYWHYPHYGNQGGAPSGAIRLGNLKLVEWYEDMRTELFDLSNDIGEKHDLSHERIQDVERLKAQLHNWRNEVHAVMPTPNPNTKSKSRQ